MKLALISRLYVCHNIAYCQDAASHRLTTSPDVRQQTCGECGEPLHLAKTRFNPLPTLAGIGLVITLGIVGKTMLFPLKHKGVSFSSALTKARENEAIATVEVVLNEPRDKSISIQYKTIAGTANKGEDFSDRNSILVFGPGEVLNRINITLIPDRIATESNETFFIELQNVEGAPTHTVVIVEEGFSKDLLEKSDVIITSLSGLAADIANDIATINMLEQYMRNTLEPAEELEQRYEQAKVNILNARERYLLLFHDVLALDPTAVISSIDNRMAVLEREGYDHQHEATQVVKKQLSEFIENRIPLVDKWMQELGKVVDVMNDSKSSELFKI